MDPFEARQVITQARAALLILVIGLLPFFRVEGQELRRFEFEAPYMGTTFRLLVYGADSVLVGRAADAAFSRVAELDERLSDYRKDSELSRLSESGGAQAAVISNDLLRVIDHSLEISRKTSGAFDITIGPLSRLWRWGMRRGVIPEDASIQEALTFVGYDGLEVDTAKSTVRLGKEGMRLDAGGIGKGFAADEALAVLTDAGFASAMVDAGGDLVMAHPPPGEAGWRIEVSTLGPEGGLSNEIVRVADEAVATSGDAYRFVEVDGVRYSHVIDPRTGYGVRDRRLVTVRADKGWRADAVASALIVLGAREGMDRARRMPGVEARYIHESTDGGFVMSETERFLGGAARSSGARP